MWAFRICHDLKIDDPAYWMNAVGGKVLDQWIAYYRIKAERQKRTSKKMTGAEALKHLQQ